MMRCILICIFLGSANAMTLQQPSAVLTGNYKLGGVNGSEPLSPIQKVVTLLREMQGQTTKEGEQDLEAYDKYMCWCETSLAEKKAAIEANEEKVAELESFLEEATAKEGQLKTEIAALEEDIAKDKDALASATALRAEENEKFKEAEADMKETLGLLSEAITVLSKVQLVQKPEAHKEALLQVKQIVRRTSPIFQSVMQKDLFDMLGEFKGAEQQRDAQFHKTVATGSFLGEVFLPKREAAVLAQNADLPWVKTEEELGKEAKPNDLVGAAAGAKSYNARSGSILGILKTQGDKFAKNLATAQKEELDALISFEHLAAAKTAEIEAATKQKDAKETELADLLDKVAKSKEDLEATQNTIAADTKFVAETEKACAEEDKLYQQRVKVRNQEIEAIAETLEILTGDEARSLFDKTISFVQLSMEEKATMAMQQKARTNAAQRILATFKKNKNWQLASLAVKVKLDAFTKVKAAMDKMVAELKAQQQEEYEKHEQCKKDIDVTEDKIKEENIVMRDLNTKHKDLENQIKVLTKDIADLKAEVAESEVSLKKAGEDRKAENQVFQTTIADQRAMMTILNMALTRLREFYDPAALTTTMAPPAALQVPNPPPKPSGPESVGYKKSGSSGGVMQMIMMIIEDAQRTEDEMHSDEQKSQANYAEFVTVTTDSIEADRKAIAEKEKQKAATEGELSETEEAQLASQETLDKLAELLQGLHAQCDYVIKYFKIRQTARQEEMDAIEEAKAILSGANFGF